MSRMYRRIVSRCRRVNGDATWNVSSFASLESPRTVADQACMVVVIQGSNVSLDMDYQDHNQSEVFFRPARQTDIEGTVRNASATVYR